MRLQREHSVALVCAGAVLCGALLTIVPAALPGGAQPAVGPAAPVGPDQLHEQLLRQLTQTWTLMAQGVAQNPQFLESPEAAPLWARMEALTRIRHGMLEAMGPPGFEPGPGENGRFQFVEWIDPGPRYWVLDTRTGELQLREAPPLDEQRG
jgi:hypothetical protein